MNLKELKELILFLKEEGVAEFELERGDVKVRIKRAGAEQAVPAAPDPGASSAMQPPGAVAPPPAKEADLPENLHTVRSPIVGTFYESPSPGSPPFVKLGDVVSLGQVLCIVEAMKLMNEIESDVAGEVVRKLVSNGQPIEYGQELFAIRVQK